MSIGRDIIADEVGSEMLIRGWHAAKGELDFPIGQFLPALDDHPAAALRNATENVAHRQTRRLQRQRECLTNKVIGCTVTKVAPVGWISHSLHETSCPSFCPASRRRGRRSSVIVARLTSLYPTICLNSFIVRWVAMHCHVWLPKLSLRQKSSITFLRQQGEGCSPDCHCAASDLVNRPLRWV
jgi:hypothetical protein